MSETKTLVDISVRKAKSQAEKERRLSMERRVNIYKDAWKDALIAEVNLQFHEKTRANIRQMVDLSQNIIKRITKEISLVYKTEARRVAYTETKAKDENGIVSIVRVPDERYQHIQSVFPTDLFMEQTNRYTNLCNESAIKISPRDEIVKLDLLTPDRFSVYQNEQDPTKIDAIEYEESFINTKGKVDVNIMYWDVEGHHRVYDKNYIDITKTVLKDADNSEGVNPYGDRIPFVISHREYATDEVLDGTSGYDLESATVQVGVLLTYLNYVFKMASFKSLWMTGIDIKDLPQGLVLDPAWIISTTGKDAKIGTVDFQVALDALHGVVNGKIISIANNYGLSTDVLRMTIDASSGYALDIKRSGLTEQREAQVKLYRHTESEVFDVTRIVNNVEYPDKKISEEAKFAIDFGDMRKPNDTKEEREDWKFKISTNARSLVDYMISQNPDLTPEEAEAQLAKNTEINNRMKSKFGISFDALFKETPGAAQE